MSVWYGVWSAYLDATNRRRLRGRQLLLFLTGETWNDVMVPLIPKAIAFNTFRMTCEYELALAVVRDVDVSLNFSSSYNNSSIWQDWEVWCVQSIVPDYCTTTWVMWKHRRSPPKGDVHVALISTSQRMGGTQAMWSFRIFNSVNKKREGEKYRRMWTFRWFRFQTKV